MKPAGWKPYATTCDTTYRAVHDSGSRPLSAVTTAVIHCTESDEGAHAARGVAAYFATQASGGSTQLVVDDLECYRCLPNDVVPWGAPPLNKCGFHIEIVGRVEWTGKQWAAHMESIRRAAFKFHQNVPKIPKVWLTVADLRAGKRRGYTSHANISRAFGQSDHTDPGLHFPYAAFMDEVKRLGK